MKKIAFLTFVIVLIPLCVSAGAKAPAYTLHDPEGGVHNVRSLLRNGGVLVMTAPTLHDEAAQEGWSNYLPISKPKGAVLVFIEDMSASDWKETARKDMQKEWKPGDVPVLLLDENGSVRKTLGVERDATVVFVYNKKGELAYTVSGAPSAASAATIWSKVK